MVYLPLLHQSWSTGWNEKYRIVSRFVAGPMFLYVVTGGIAGTDGVWWREWNQSENGLKLDLILVLNNFEVNCVHNRPFSVIWSRRLDYI